jgi:hypothetical protein
MLYGQARDRSSPDSFSYCCNFSASLLHPPTGSHDYASIMMVVPVDLPKVLTLTSNDSIGAF